MGRIEKCTGDDKIKLRRWIRDLATLQATHPDVVVAVAERNARENLADTIEAFLANPRGNIAWPAVRDNVVTLLLGDAYEGVYLEPWDAVTNQMLMAHFAAGLLDKRMVRDVGVVLRKPTLCETINQTRSYAGIEATMDLRNPTEIAAVAPVAEGQVKKKDKASNVKEKAASDADYAALAKQVASISSQLGEMKAGTRKPPPGGQEYFNCGKLGHFARDCRSGPRRPTPAHGGGRSAARGRARTYVCYECGQNVHYARDCHQSQPAPCGGVYRRGRGRGYSGYQEQPPAEHQYYAPGPPAADGYPQRPASHCQGQQVAAAAHYDPQQGNW